MLKVKKETIFVLLIFLLAVGLRLGYSFFLKNHYFFYGSPGSDVTYYQKWANEIAMGNWIGEETFFGLPLYPYFLGVLTRLCLGNLFAMRLFHILLGSLNCVLLYYLARKIFSQRVAMLSAILAASNFTLIYYDWLMMPVTLLILLSLILIWSLLHFSTVTPRREWFLLGLFMGVTILGDGKILFFFALVCLYILCRWPKPFWQKISRIILPLGLSVFLVLFSVTIRNKIIGGDWVFISAQSGLSLYVGNNPDATGTFENPDFIRPTHRGQDEDQRVIAEAAAQRKLSPGEVSQFWRQKATSFIRERPLDYLTLLGKKCLVFVKDIEWANDIDLILQREWRQRFDYNPYFILCPLALAGMFLAWRRGKNTAYLNLLILSQLILILIFFLTTRHRATILPVFILYESFLFWWVIDQIRHRNIKQLGLAASFIAIFLILFQPESVDSKTIQFLSFTKSGAVYEKQGQYKKAREQYIKALKLRPFDTNSLYNLGTAYLMEGDLAKAQPLLRKVVETCHYHVDALYNLGYTYEQTDSLGLALQSYKQVLTYQPEDLDIHFRIATIYQKQGNCQKAREHYLIITEKQPLFTDKIQSLMSECKS